MLSQIQLQREILQMTFIKWRTLPPRGDVAREAEVLGVMWSITWSRFSGSFFFGLWEIGMKQRWSLLGKGYFIQGRGPHFNPCQRGMSGLNNQARVSALTPVPHIDSKGWKSHRLPCPSVHAWVFVTNQNAFLIYSIYWAGSSRPCFGAVGITVSKMDTYLHDGLVEKLAITHKQYAV